MRRWFTLCSKALLGANVGKHSWLANVLASHIFKVTSLNVTRTSLKQLTFTLVEDFVFNAITSNYSIIETFVRLTYLVECRFRKILEKSVWLIIIQSERQSARSHESSIYHSWQTVVWVLLTRKHFHLTPPGQYMLFAQEALHVASKLIVLDN